MAKMQLVKMDEEMYGRQMRARARMHQKSKNPDIRRLYVTPKKNWPQNRNLGARVSEAGKIREANILDALTMFGPAKIAKIKQLCGVPDPNNDRLTISCLDRMMRDGKIEKEPGVKPMVYCLASQGNAA